MLKFHALDWYKTATGGHVAVVKAEERPKIGDDVEIDGMPYRAAGIETVLLPPQKGEMIGILVAG